MRIINNVCNLIFRFILGLKYIDKSLKLHNNVETMKDDAKKNYNKKDIECRITNLARKLNT